MSLRVENLHFRYKSGHPVLRNLNLEIKAGWVTGMFGSNGSGKSTLLRCLNGFLRPQSGSVYIEGQRLDLLSPREIARRVAVVPQETTANAPFLVREMVMMGRFAGWNAWGKESSQDHEVVHASLKRVGSLNLSDRHFDQLSGGERQRVVIARALAQETRVLLMDEPASHLDIAHQLEMLQLVRSLALEGYTILMVCHDLVIAPMFLNTAVLLKEGRILASGDVQRVLQPHYLRDCFGCSFEIIWPSHGMATITIKKFESSYLRGVALLPGQADALPDAPKYSE